ncbi:MAG TPA: hypothetical protein EYQ42_12080 [Thiotrichaceae bacterium]|jgi:hypothetical protein|nr:hypothetical protein [Thiotrichaceae bacterium]
MRKLLLTILLLSFGQAQAGFITGSELLERCEAHVNKTNVAKGNGCVGYVEGISDAHGTFTEWKNMDKKWCEPENAHTEAP